MCGIAGWYKFGNKSVTKDEVVTLVKSLETRGTDATGIAWYDENKGKVIVIKCAMKSTEFVQEEAFLKRLNDIVSSRWCLIHVRQATHGSPGRSVNNHPIWNRTGLIIHNGVVTATKGHLKADGETDSEQMMLYIQKYGWNGIKHIRGWAAIAYVNFSHKDKFFLYRDSAPIEYAYDEGKDLFLFCSTNPILNEAIKIETHTLPESKLYVVNKKGWYKVHNVKMASYASMPDFSKGGYYNAWCYGYGGIYQQSPDQRSTYWKERLSGINLAQADALANSIAEALPGTNKQADAEEEDEMRYWSHV